jgi:hypothetical protein
MGDEFDIDALLEEPFNNKVSRHFSKDLFYQDRLRRFYKDDFGKNLLNK